MKYILGLLRLSMGWIFFWAFIDKLWGLGFATQKEAAWLAGGSPTFGFLKFATKGPFAEIFQGIAGSAFIDWIFMLGLLFVGLCLLLGVLVRLASWMGVLIVSLMYLAGFMPPEHNPFLDEHFVYAVILAGLALSGSGRFLGLGKWWSKSRLVGKYSFLE